MGVEPRIATAYALYGVTGFRKRVKSGRSKHYAAKRWQIVEPLPQEIITTCSRPVTSCCVRLHGADFNQRGALS
jgi:hypothetical protein